MNAPRDIPNNLLESLKSLGLTKYEALVYIGLLRVAGATATEIHEISGVPRASVYPVLDRLVQKELVSVSYITPKRFDAVPPDRGVENLMRRIETDAKSARAALDALYREKRPEGRGNQEQIWTIYGEENIRTRLAGMFRSAERSVEVLATVGSPPGEPARTARSRSRLRVGRYRHRLLGGRAALPVRDSCASPRDAARDSFPPRQTASV